MRGVRLSQPAINDIEGIWDFIAQDNPAAATAFTAALAEKFAMLADQPHAGRLCQHLGRGILRFPIGNYVIFYRATSAAIEIARVMHGARDIEALCHDKG